MKAIVQDRYGSKDVLQLRDIDKPVVKDDEVLVCVRAASVARGVWHFMTGLPYPIRFAGGLRAPKTPVPGMDMTGVIEAVGNAVTGSSPAMRCSASARARSPNMPAQRRTDWRLSQ
jgi:NADPH:quinone reductase-like Zn-dependent oxidoreductase